MQIGNDIICKKSYNMFIYCYSDSGQLFILSIGLSERLYINCECGAQAASLTGPSKQQ